VAYSSNALKNCGEATVAATETQHLRI